MIVFCEDCGEKNSITFENMDNGQVVFTCQLCGYKNNYKLKTSEDPLSKQQTSNFVGGFIYHKHLGLTTNQMPASLTRKDLTILGKTLFENVYRFSQLYTDARLMSMEIHQRYTVVLPVDHHQVAVMVFKTSCSVEQMQPFYKKLTSNIAQE